GRGGGGGGGGGGKGGRGGGKGLEKALGCHGAWASETFAGAGQDRLAVQGCTGPRLRHEQFLGGRRENRRQHRTAVTDERHRNGPVILAGKIGTRSIAPGDNPHQPGHEPPSTALV